ncbi:MAG TPA: pyrroloquinoline quinone-dependent dehydrogenase [Terriglobia bacterium]|nr:pyrroloquinoline quinone-dependent dehydrogenase [Terriglobia bacterium]
MNLTRICGVIALAATVLACGRRAIQRDATAPIAEWPTYGNDPGSSRYSPLAEVSPQNVKDLKLAWTFHTGDVARGGGTWNGQKVWARSTFEATPLMVDDTLYVASSFNRIIALDPETGREKWAFDPKLDRIGYYGDYFTCRGLATWVDPASPTGQACHRTIFEAVLDGRLVAVDGATGQPCAAFGDQGQVSLTTGIKTEVKGEYHFTSPPAVVGNVVVVGSAINDNDRVDMPAGVVRAYNARTGALVWAWDPVPRDPSDPARATWQNGADRTGAANVWGPVSSDPEHDLVFLPTTSPSPDFFGGARKGDDRNADSLVALRASTGKVAWAFQAVHHDLWDYDLPSGPSLININRDGQSIAALAQPSKMGYVFILNRDTGQPEFPVEEKPVPQDGVPGEWLSPTQPVPTAPPRLVPDHLDPKDAWGLSPWDRGKCRDLIASLRREGPFTPPSLQGTLEYPGNIGGTNWGGLAFDRSRGLIVGNQSNIPFIVQLIPREQVTALRQRAGGMENGWEYAPMKGTPYVMRRRALLSSWQLPCNAPPWGTLAAVDADTGRIRWQVPLGTMRELAPLPLPIAWGTPTLGGPITTASGLTFIGATLDSTFRAFDTATGKELWHADLTASAMATPITYRARPGGRQYVVVAAGGHGKAGDRLKLDDSVVAFALP